MESDIAVVDAQIFISYRATHSMFARQVADQLISAGSEVWFAEYETFDWRLRRDETWVESKISDGIQNSKRGIVFTSDDYMKSPACRFELSLMLDRIGVGKIVQISLDGALLDALDKRRTIICSQDEVREAVDFMAMQFEIDMSYLVPPARKLAGLTKRRKFGGWLSLDAYGWKRWWRGALDALVNPYDVAGQASWRQARWGPFLQRDVYLRDGNKSKILMNLRYGKEESYWSDKWSFDFQAIEDDSDKEKQVLNKLNEYASTVHLPSLEKQGVQVQRYGVHVLEKKYAFGDIALTYRLEYDNCSIWIRKTAVRLPDPDCRTSYYELVFTFSFYGLFSDYCRYCGVMDELAMSVIQMP
jgi:hypothetical protein